MTKILPMIKPALVAWCGQCHMYSPDLLDVGGSCLFGGTGLATDNCETPMGRVPIMRRRRGWLCLICQQAGEPFDFFFNRDWAANHEEHSHVGSYG